MDEGDVLDIDPASSILQPFTPVDLTLRRLNGQNRCEARNYPDPPRHAAGVETESEERLRNIVPLLVTVGFSVVGVLGDYLLKLASVRRNPMRSGWFYLGFAVYASTAFGWVYVMRRLKLATIGVVYSISMIVMLTAIGVVGFKEALNPLEVVGVLLAVGSLVLLVRFA